jgi:hypothetical protein
MHRSKFPCAAPGNLTTLAPDIVATILDESLPPDVTLFELAAGTPVVWEGQWGSIKGFIDLGSIQIEPTCAPISVGVE